MQTAIPCVLMRGGTSRGPIFNADDLPVDTDLRDRVLLRVMGSPDLRQIDGLGGATTVTSKVAIVSPADHPWASVDYLFAQVAIDDALVDTGPSCGNMLAAVGPYAIETGLVPAEKGQTSVRIHNVNTGALIEALVETPGGHVTYEGDASISGVPGTGSAIVLRLRNIVGAKTGKMFPTGNRRDVINDLAVSCMDVAMPMVFVRAADMGKTAHESPAQLNGDGGFLNRLELLRQAAAEAMGFGDVRHSVIPKIALVGEAQGDGDLASRYFTPKRAHPSYAVLGAICVASAAAMPDSVVRDVTSSSADERDRTVIEHPSGTIEVGIDLTPTNGDLDVAATVLRTARPLFSGHAHVPTNVWAGP